MFKCETEIIGIIERELNIKYILYFNDKIIWKNTETYREYFDYIIEKHQEEDHLKYVLTNYRCEIGSLDSKIYREYIIAYEVMNKLTGE